LNEANSSLNPDTSASTAESGGLEQSGLKNFDKKYLIALVVLSAALTFIAYLPILFDFFAGDDFGHLVWLKEAVKNPEMIWRNFHSSWLDGTNTKFYRPLISVFMVSDYVLWNGSGLGFHLTNLLFHISSTVFIFFIARELAALTLREEEGAKERRKFKALPVSLSRYWPFIAATIFGLYPLHIETVSWITGRVDVIVSTFITGSFWFYLKARRTDGKGKKLSVVLSIVLLALGLLSKEMAITLPAIFVLLELLYASPQEQPRTVLAGVLSPTYWTRAVKNTAIFWGLIGVYFVVRFFSLGTLVGGYDNSLFFISNIKVFINTWLSGLKTFVEPLNRELLSHGNIFARLWDLYLGLIGIGVLINLILTPALGRLFLFLCGWLVLSLVPVYKVFAISHDLQGSRLAYVATVPLSLLFAFAAVVVSRGVNARIQLISRNALAVGFLALCFYVLSVNNTAWIDAGNEANNIRAALGRLYTKVPGDPQVLFIGLPDQIHGAYVSRNALEGMTRTPQLHRDVYNAVMVNPFEPMMPFGFLKDTFYSDRNKILIYNWSRPNHLSGPGDFEKVDLDEIKQYPVQEFLAFAGKDLQDAVKPSDPDARAKGVLESAGLTLVGEKGKERPQLTFSIGPLNTYGVEFVAVKLKVNEASEGFKAAALKEGADLLYSNDLVPEFNIKSRTPTAMPTEVGEATLIFPLRSLPEWSLGGKAKLLRLRLPHESNCTVEEVVIAPAASLIPQITFANSGYLGSKGFIHLTKNLKEADIAFDVSKIAGDAIGVEMEITRTNLLFEEQNCSTKSRVALLNTNIDGKSGTIKLKRDMFPGVGLYQLRLWPRFAGGKFGQASDHIVVAVDS